MKLDPQIEQKIKEAALAELSKGKPEWDIPHTLNAVGWIKKLIETEGGDEKILVPVMYLHDTGYPMLEKGYDYDQMIESKLGHSERSARFAEKILPTLNYFTPEEFEEIVYLVRNHDKHDNLETLNRQLVFEADSLSVVDWENLKPTFDRENRIKFLKNFFANEKGLERYNTETGKRCLQELLVKAEEYNKYND